IVERNTADRTSAAPAIARKTSASGNENVDRPNPTIAAPQIATAAITPAPIRRTADTQPESTAPRSAPTAGAAAIRPSPAGPTLNTSRARAGKSDVGMP